MPIMQRPGGCWARCRDRQARRGRGADRTGRGGHRRGRRRLPGILLDPDDRPAAAARLAGTSADRDPCSRRPYPPLRVHRRRRTRLVSPADDGAGRRRPTGPFGSIGRAPEKLGLAILAQDKPALAQAEGVGPRLAARIINELRDKIGGIASPRYRPRGRLLDDPANGRRSEPPTRSRRWRTSASAAAKRWAQSRPRRDGSAVRPAPMC